MKEPIEFIAIGADLVNIECILNDAADELEKKIEAGSKILGSKKGFKKGRKLPGKIRKLAKKARAAHVQAQKEAEDKGYDIQTGEDFRKSCKDAGISVRSGGGR